MHNASMIEKQTALLSLASSPVILSQREAKLDSSIVKTVVCFDVINLTRYTFFKIFSSSFPLWRRFLQMENRWTF
jgi:hypothetical protein